MELDLHEVENSPYMRLLAFAVSREVEGQGFTLEEAIQAAAIEQRDFEDGVRAGIISEGRQRTHPDNRYYYQVTLEGFLACLEFLQLKDARENARAADEHARKAMHLGLWSLWVAIAALVMSGVIGILGAILRH